MLSHNLKHALRPVSQLQSQTTVDMCQYAYGHLKSDNNDRLHLYPLPWNLFSRQRRFKICFKQVKNTDKLFTIKYLIFVAFTPDINYDPSSLFGHLRCWSHFQAVEDFVERSHLLKRLKNGTYYIWEKKSSHIFKSLKISFGIYWFAKYYRHILNISRFCNAHEMLWVQTL